MSNKKVVFAKFIGQNGSLGYEVNKAYELVFEIEHPYFKIQDRLKKCKPCLYGTMAKFLENWKVVK